MKSPGPAAMGRSREARASAHRPANFDDANLRRSAHAAAVVSARVHRALEILNGDVPELLLIAARLRLQHPPGLPGGARPAADPPMSKDAIAGRLRRLLAMADTAARNAGIPDTHAAAPENPFPD